MTVCGYKPENGKAPQITGRQSDESIVVLKQGNACGEKGLTSESHVQGHFLPSSMVEYQKPTKLTH